MNLVMALTLKIIILMIIGYVAKITGIIDEVCKDKMSTLLVNLFLPVSMIASSQQSFKLANLRGCVSVAIIASVYYILAFSIGGMIGRACGMDKDKRSIFILLIAFANTGFVGMPVLKEIIGDTGTLYGAVYNSVFDILYFSYGISIIDSEKDDKSRNRLNRILNKKIIGNPMIWIAIITTVLYVVPYRLPLVVTESLNLIGNCMMPISMLIIGAEIAGMDIKKVLADKESYGVSFIRMIAIPSITLLINRLLNVEYTVLATVTILAAMPSGSLNVIMGQKYRNNPKFAAGVVMQNTLIMIITLPLFIYLLQKK